MREIDDVQASVSQDRYKKAETDVEPAVKELAEMETKIIDFVEQA